MIRSVRIITLLLSCCGRIDAQPLSIQWQKCLGGSYDDQISVILQTANNHFLLGGSTISNDGDVSGNHGLSSDFWIVEIDSSGNLIKQKCFGGSGQEILASMIFNGTSYKAVGRPGSIDGDVSAGHGPDLDFWIMSADTIGNIIWEVCLGGSRTEEPFQIIKSYNNSSVIIGLARSTDYDVTGLHDTTSTLFLSDVWVVKIDSLGGILWAKCYGGLYPDIGYSIIQTKDSGFIFCASTQSNDGDVHGQHQVSTEDFWVVKLDSLGNIQWDKCYGGTDDERPWNIIGTKDGGYAVIGLSKSINYDVGNHHGGIGDEDAWVIKIDSIGNLEWEKSLGGTLYDYGVKIIQLEDTGYLALCYTTSIDGDLVATPANGIDIWLVRLDQLGNILWSQCFGGSSDEAAYDMLLTHDGGLIFGGITFSNDGDVSGNHGNGDAWIAKLTPLPDKILTPIVLLNDFIPSLNSTNELTIKYNAKTSAKFQIELFDISGRRLLSNIIAFNEGINQLTIHTPEITPGLYIVRVDKIVKKVIVFY